MFNILQILELYVNSLQLLKLYVNMLFVVFVRWLQRWSWRRRSWRRFLERRWRRFRTWRRRRLQRERRWRWRAWFQRFVLKDFHPLAGRALTSNFVIRI